jgi:hypothetical protein
MQQDEPTDQRNRADHAEHERDGILGHGASPPGDGWPVGRRDGDPLSRSRVEDREGHRNLLVVMMTIARSGRAGCDRAHMGCELIPARSCAAAGVVLSSG